MDLSPERIQILLQWVKLIASLLALAGALLLDRRAKQGGFPFRMRRGLAAAGCCGLLLWADEPAAGVRPAAHSWDIAHYLLGARYFPELGYTGLYGCIARADIENGHGDEVAAREARDLADNRLRPATELARTADCAERFSPDRWQSFRADVEALRPFVTSIGEHRWAAFQRDHGFNASPVWLLLARPMADALSPPGSPRPELLPLADLALLGVAWLAVADSFPLHATAVAMGYFGLDELSRYGWVNGSFLRQDWLFLLLVGLVLLRRNRPGSAGASLVASALLRLFPGLVLAGIATVLALRARTGATEDLRREASRELRRVATGAMVAAAVLVPLATRCAGRGWRVWVEFAENTAKHAETPLRNHVGWAALLGAEGEDATKERVVRIAARERLPFTEANAEVAWSKAHREAFREKLPLFFLALAIAVFLYFRAVREAPAWMCGCAALLLLPFAADLTCYYYVAWVAVALLAADVRGMGPLLFTFAAAGHAVSLAVGDMTSKYRILSLAAVVVSLTALGLLNACRRKRSDGVRDATQSSVDAPSAV